MEACVVIDAREQCCSELVGGSSAFDLPHSVRAEVCSDSPAAASPAVLSVPRVRRVRQTFAVASRRAAHGESKRSNSPLRSHTRLRRHDGAVAPAQRRQMMQRHQMAGPRRSAAWRRRVAWPGRSSSRPLALALALLPLCVALLGCTLPVAGQSVASTSTSACLVRIATGAAMRCVMTASTSKEPFEACRAQADRVASQRPAKAHAGSGTQNKTTGG